MSRAILSTYAESDMSRAILSTYTDMSCSDTPNLFLGPISNLKPGVTYVHFSLTYINIYPRPLQCDHSIVCSRASVYMGSQEEPMISVLSKTPKLSRCLFYPRGGGRDENIRTRAVAKHLSSRAFLIRSAQQIFSFCFSLFLLLDLHDNADLLFLLFLFFLFFIYLFIYLFFVPYPDVMDKISQDP